MNTPFGVSSLSSSERAGLAAWIRDALALVALVVTLYAIYVAAGTV